MKSFGPEKEDIEMYVINYVINELISSEYQRICILDVYFEINFCFAKTIAISFNSTK